MKKIIIKKKPGGWYFACTEDTDAVLATGETKEDCIANFNKLDLASTEDSAFYEGKVNDRINY